MPFTTGILFFIVGLYVFLKRRGAAENRAYALWCYTTVHWQLTWAVIYSLNDSRLVDGLTRFGYSGIIFIPIAFYHFIITFLKNSSRRRQVATAYVLACVFVVTVWTGHSFVIKPYKYFWGYYPQVGWIHNLYLLLLAYLVLDGLSLLIRALQKEPSNGTRKMQIRYVTWACAIYVLAALDFLPNYGIPLYPIGVIFTLISLGLVTYAIAKHQLLDINLIIRKTLIYSLMSAILTSVYFLIVTLFTHFSSGITGRSSLISIGAAGIAVTLIFLPLFRRIQRFLDRYFFREALDQALLREATSGFVHEIKRPLANISLPTELTLMDLRDVKEKRRSFKDVFPKIEQRLEYILSQTADAGNKIEAIRSFSHSNGKPPEQIDLADIIRRSASVEESLLRRFKVQLKLGIADDLPSIYGHARQLEIVFTNLIKNAAEALSKLDPAAARNIWVNVSQTDGKILISVKDSGPGIKKENLPHLFEPYFTTKGGHGMGMGLYLCHQIVQAHGGNININQKTPEYCELIVQLPKYL